jgi:MerR family mercuric resistance operon transcriptional regulator
MKPLTIGQVARAAGIGVETVRFYERQGLLQAPPRGASGYRQYPQQAVARLQFVKRAKELGFSLKEIKELLDLRLDPATTCADVRSRAAAKISAIEEKIESLRRMQQALKTLTATCNGKGSARECPILDALDADSRGSRRERSR